MSGPIPYAPADPVATMLVDDYGMDPKQAAAVSARLKGGEPDKLGVAGEAFGKVANNEIKRMDTLVANAQRFADIKARREAGEQLEPEDEEFYGLIRRHAISKMAADKPVARDPAQDQRTRKFAGIGAAQPPDSPADYAFQAMDAADNGMTQARQLQGQAQERAGAFQSTAHGRVPIGPGAEAAQVGMGGAAGGAGGAAGPSVPQPGIAELLRKRWEEEQLRAANGGFGPLPMDTVYSDGMRAQPYPAIDPWAYLDTLGNVGASGLPRSGR